MSKWSGNYTGTRKVNFQDVPVGMEFANSIIPSDSYRWVKVDDRQARFVGIDGGLVEFGPLDTVRIQCEQAIAGGRA